jgi:uncharacterized protein (UPF0335 family)
MTNEILKPETKEQLKNYVAEIERLNSKKDQLQAEIREVFDSAKSKGFDVKNIREIIKLRKRDKQEMVHSEEVREFYKDILIEL